MSLPPPWETQMELRALTFSLAQPWVSWAYEEQVADLGLSFSQNQQAKQIRTKQSTGLTRAPSSRTQARRPCPPYHPRSTVLGLAVFPLFHTGSFLSMPRPHSRVQCLSLTVVSCPPIPQRVLPLPLWTHPITTGISYGTVAIKAKMQ